LPPAFALSRTNQTYEGRAKKYVAQKSTGPVSSVCAYFAVVMRAQDRANCSNATLHGGYGLHATGTIIAVGDFAAVGRFTFDGKGNLTGKLFTNAAGNYRESQIGRA